MNEYVIITFKISIQFIDIKNSSESNHQMTLYTAHARFYA